jgi:glucuronate isomerase
MAFLDEHYLLTGETAHSLFRKIGALPILDPHNHANVAEIAANVNYPNPWALFAATDHYVWEVLRKRGVPEPFITGDAPPREKWLKMASVFPEIAGNPVYEWIHLDLKRYLGIDTILGPDTGAETWDEASAALARPDMRPQQLLAQIGVETMCSTDDPVDLLEDHAKVNAAVGYTLLRPTWRPDRAMNIAHRAWPEYLGRLESRFGRPLNGVADLVAVLRISHDHFAECGCRASDHGVRVPFPATTDAAAADLVFQAARAGRMVSPADVALFGGYLLTAMAEMNAARGWVCQLHLGPVRDVRDHLARTLGPDSGGDVSDHHLELLAPLTRFLNAFDDRLKVVLYCLEPGHQPTLATVARAFGAKVNLGAAWWLNDTPVGMRRQLEYIGSVDLLANFAGMVSDSRKLLSYGSRFEMFRRVLADVLGQMVDRGQLPFDVAAALAERMCHSGVKRFWSL